MVSQKTKAAGLVALAAVIVWGCESSDVLAPAGSMIIVEANPGTVVIDITETQDMTDPPETEGQSVISAQVFDTTGAFTLSGVDVTFTTDVGTLASSTNACTAGTCTVSGGSCRSDVDCPAVSAQTVTTDENGVARDTLTLTLQDEGPATVTVRSSTVTGSVTVAKSVIDGSNQEPIAVITSDPVGGQVFGAFATFDGRGSTDSDGPITCYRWTITSSPTVATSDEVVESRTATFVSRRYSDAQQLTVTLQITDREDADTYCGSSDSVADPTQFNSQDILENYPIVCDLTGPVANAGDDISEMLTGTSVTVNLSSSGSSDDDSGIDSYSWICEQGDTSPQNTPSATCTYDAVGVYVATLTVTNGCSMMASDTVTINVEEPDP